MLARKLEPEESEKRIERLHKQYVDEKLHCSKKIFLVIHSLLEIDFSPETVALLSGLAGGIGGTHSSACGAVTGGIAALGLAYGKCKPPEELAEGSRRRG
jgi:C_GCAxxG_C_C family probable redox protein